MRKTLTALLFTAALPTLAFAAPGEHMGMLRDHEHNHCAMMNGANHGKAMKDLGLTKEQRQKVHEAHRAEMEKSYDITQRYLNKLSKSDKAEMDKELQTMREQQSKAMRDALTPEQQKRYDEALKQQEQERADRAAFEEWKAARDAKEAKKAN